MTRYLTVLLTNIQLLPASPIGQLIRGRSLRLGRPAEERSGVLGRQVVWAHDFPRDMPNGPISILMDNGVTVTGTLSSAKPTLRVPIDL